MAVAFQLLALVGMTCATASSGFLAQFTTPEGRISHTASLLAPLFPLQVTDNDRLADKANDRLADKALLLDDDDFKNDFGSSPFVFASLETRKAGNFVDSKLQDPTTFSWIAKHPRIYFLCALVI